MDLDDLPVGRVLSRREVVALLGSAGAFLLLGSRSAGSRAGKSLRRCVVRPASTQGPYYVDEGLNRSDIRSDPTDGSVRQGALLALTLSVSTLSKGACAPLEGAVVDLWQCDADGVYSDAKDPRYFDTIGRKFLRGYQVTDRNGLAKFITIYPGWYPQRTPHIHYKIRSPASASSPYEFVGQMYFEERVTDKVYAEPPYARRGKRNVSNLTDQIYNRDGGRRSMLNVTRARAGYAGAFDVALDLS
jgi:protocatechuate 3,4-dioxygenase beta subunit